MDISELKQRAVAFQRELDGTKAALAPQSFGWYPYGTLSNFGVLDQLLRGERRRLLELIDGRLTVDIGCADGDLAFFLETLGCRVAVIDYAPTNYNGLQGLRLLKSALNSRVEIHEVDLDSQFVLPGGQSYGLVFLLGTLYHLKNPYFVLESIARRARFCLISTRIARYASGRRRRLRLFRDRREKSDRVKLADLPVAYLLDELECNDDFTNYWIFSEGGLHRILRRAGWSVSDYLSVGNTADSDPASAEGDERAFCLVRSRLVV